MNKSIGLSNERKRCSWCLGHPLYVAYHDEEWGEPVHDDRKFFEMLILEGAQAGLSWLTILKRREGYDNWDVEKIARYGDRDRERLLGDERIIRNRLKVDASIANARAFLETQKEFGSFDRYIWRFTQCKTLRPAKRPETLADIPREIPESRELSKDLKRRGFRFVGPVVCYSFMQACGMADDHMRGCFKAKRSGMKKKGT